MSEEEQRKFPHKNVITRALGMRETVQVDVLAHDIHDQDIFIMCSDGLSGMVEDPKLLEEAGIAAARHFGPGQTLYEVSEGRAHHDHLICDSCGFITEFESDEIEDLQEATAKRFGFNVARHRHELFGLCEKARGLPNGRCPGEEAGRKIKR